MSEQIEWVRWGENNFVGLCLFSHLRVSYLLTYFWSSSMPIIFNYSSNLLIWKSQIPLLFSMFIHSSLWVKVSLICLALKSLFAIADLLHVQEKHTEPNQKNFSHLVSLLMSVSFFFFSFISNSDSMRTWQLKAAFKCPCQMIILWDTLTLKEHKKINLS